MANDPVSEDRLPSHAAAFVLANAPFSSVQRRSGGSSGSV